jgi:hypothetical protein
MGREGAAWGARVTHGERGCRMGERGCRMKREGAAWRERVPHGWPRREAREARGSEIRASPRGARCWSAATPRLGTPRPRLVHREGAPARLNGKAAPPCPAGLSPAAVDGPRQLSCDKPRLR